VQSTRLLRGCSDVTFTWVVRRYIYVGGAQTLHLRGWWPYLMVGPWAGISRIQTG
jgi:hypothetical protein